MINFVRKQTLQLACQREKKLILASRLLREMQYRYTILDSLDSYREWEATIRVGCKYETKSHLRGHSFSIFGIFELIDKHKRYLTPHIDNITSFTPRLVNFKILEIYLNCWWRLKALFLLNIRISHQNFQTIWHHYTSILSE